VVAVESERLQEEEEGLRRGQKGNKLFGGLRKRVVGEDETKTPLLNFVYALGRCAHVLLSSPIFGLTHTPAAVAAAVAREESVSPLFPPAPASGGCGRRNFPSPAGFSSAHTQHIHQTRNA